MKRLVIGIAISAMCLSSIAGCGGSNTSGSATTAAGVDISTEAASSVAESEKDKTEESTTAAETVAANYEVPFTMADIDWHVEEGVLYGERAYVFGYTNNTDCDILNFKIEYVKKSDTTDEQMLEAFSSEREENDGYLTDEEIVDNTLGVYCNRFVAAGANTEQEPVLPYRGLSYVTSEQFDLFEPDIATIIYTDDTYRYCAYYDFKNDKLSLDTSSTEAKYEWSDSDLSSLVPKPTCANVDIQWDDDDWFLFEAYGVDTGFYTEYKNLCIENGFTEEADDSDHRYSAKNSDGVQLELNYDDDSNWMNCDVSIEK